MSGLSVAGREPALADGARDGHKSPGLLCQRVDVRSACIRPHQETWPLAVVCAGRDGMLRGCDSEAHRPAALLARVRAMHSETRPRAGERSDTVWAGNLTSLWTAEGW